MSATVDESNANRWIEVCERIEPVTPLVYLLWDCSKGNSV